MDSSTPLLVQRGYVDRPRPRPLSCAVCVSLQGGRIYSVGDYFSSRSYKYWWLWQERHCGSTDDSVPEFRGQPPCHPRKLGVLREPTCRERGQLGYLTVREQPEYISSIRKSRRSCCVPMRAKCRACVPTVNAFFRPQLRTPGTNEVSYGEGVHFSFFRGVGRKFT